MWLVALRLLVDGLEWLEAMPARVAATGDFLRARTEPIALIAVMMSICLLGGIEVRRDIAVQPAEARRAAVVATVVKRNPPPANPAPAALQARLEALALRYGEPVGIAVADVEAGWIAGVRNTDLFPQQSVSKLWVALAILDAVDQGRLHLDQWVVMTPHDRSVFYQPIARRIGTYGYATTLGDLLRRALVESDNAANDKLMAEVGGAHAVTELLARKGLDGIRLGGDEKTLQSYIAGMTWRPEYGVGGAFKAARELVPEAVRDSALAAYLADPLDGATPEGVVRALAALHKGELVSRPSTEVIVGAMNQARTGPRRLKGGLPEGWTIAHKTGTGQDWRGASVGINDVGLITAPDGRTYAVAVLIRRTAKPIGARLAFMQEVTRAVAESWEAGD